MNGYDVMLRFFIIPVILILVIIMVLAILYIRKRSQRSRQRPLEITDKALQLKTLNTELQPFGFSYNLRQDMFYSLKDCWQREFGYCNLYDEAAPALGMIMDCEPVEFNYNGKRWLIEFWKGQYGMTTGAEIGIYNTIETELHVPDFFDGSLYHSAADSERLYMSYTLLKNNEVVFSRSDLHWWLTGFKLGEFSEPADLKMEIRLTFPTRSMCNAFLEALFQSGYTYSDVMVRYHTVFFTFDKPHAKQPLSRSALIDYMVQKNNSLYCRTYQHATKNYDDTLDKLEYLRIYSPEMYHSILNIGKTKDIFESYEALRSYENSSR
jgi:hypothetical protein